MEYLIPALASIVVGILSLVGVILTNASSNKKIEKSLETRQAITDYKIDELAKKVEKHNNVVERTYHLEQEVALVMEKISVANHRIGDLEKGVQNEKN